MVSPHSTTVQLVSPHSATVHCTMYIPPPLNFAVLEILHPFTYCMYILLLFNFCTFLSYSSTVHSAPFNYFTVLSATIQLLYCTFRHSPQLINYLTFFPIQLLYFFATIQLYRLPTYYQHNAILCQQKVNYAKFC